MAEGMVDGMADGRVDGRVDGMVASTVDVALEDVGGGHVACWSPLREARSIDTKPSSFSSSWAVRELADVRDERFRVATICRHSLPRRWHRSQVLPSSLRMHRHLALEQLVQDRP